MSEWRAEIARRLAPLRLPPARELEIADELAQHLEDRYQEMRAAGRDHGDAVAAAWRELEAQDVLHRGLARIERSAPLELPPPGSPARGRWLSALWQDVRNAGRALRKEPLFTATVLVALALSIGPATAILSFGDWLFWRPLPGLVDANRLALVYFGHWEDDGVSPSGVSYLNIADLRTGLTAASGFAGVQEQSASLIVGDDAPRVVGTAFVTANFFEVTGARPIAGRSFAAEEDRAAPGAPVLVISERLARRSFGSPAGALDRSVLLNKQPFRVIGVAPPGFAGVMTTSTVDVWLTGATFPYLFSARSARLASRSDGIFSLFVARLAPRSNFTALEAEIVAQTRRLLNAYPDENKKFQQVAARVFPNLNLDPLSRPRMRTMVGILFSIGAVLLLLGCANVANMLIARAIRRDQEIAVRRALGASGWRLVQLQVAESWILAVGGAALGLALAVVLKQVMQQLLFPVPPGTMAPVPLDGRVLTATLGTAAGVGTIAGLLPAWLSSRGRLGGRTNTIAAVRTSTRVPRLRSALAVVQLALSLTLLVGALLLISTLRNLRAVDLGFAPADVSVFRMDLSAAGYTPPRALLHLHDLLDVLSGLPSLAQVTLGDRAPFEGRTITRVEPPGATPAVPLDVDTIGIAHNYLEVLGIPMLRGRAFTPEDVFADGPRETTPAILNEVLARRLFGDGDPIGRTVRLAANISEPARDLPVVGVVRDAHLNNITAQPGAFIYLPLGRAAFGAMRPALIVRSARPIAEVAAAVRAAGARLDRSLPISGGQPLVASIERGMRQQVLFATMLTWVSALAFVLAAVGLHGLVAQTTTERTREFGIRLAIGASRGAIVGLLARYVIVIASIGTALGLALAAIGSGVVKSMLYGVTTLQPAVYVAAVVVMGAIVVVASAWPAVRATRVDPMVALRDD